MKTIAHLARTGLDEAASERLAADLNTVLALVAELRALDTAGVEPMAHPLDAVLHLREGEVTRATGARLCRRPLRTLGTVIEAPR